MTILRELVQVHSEIAEAIPQSRVQCEGLRIEFVAAGSGKALVLVHGLLGYSFSWRNVVPVLARERRVLAPDMPGAGFSECRGDLDCRLNSAAIRLKGFLDAVQVGSCDLIGSSYGGATAILLAGLDPARIRSLVLVSPANPWSRIGRKRLALLRNSGAAALFPQIARAVHPTHKYFVRRMWGNPALISAETLDGYARPLMRPGVFEHAVRIVRSWQDDMSQVEATLPKIASIPTLLVWGSRDRVVEPASAREIQRRLPGTQLEIMQGAGHLPYEERPDEFCRMVLDFLHRVESNAGSSSAREVT